MINPRVLPTLNGRDPMAIGYILINTSPKKEYDVYQEIRKLEEVKDVTPLFGEYDIIAKIEMEDMRSIAHVVVDKIRKIPGVIDTKTLAGTSFDRDD